MRLMQLFTGAINSADYCRYETDSLHEKMNFVNFMVAGNDNCMALFSAWSLLNFSAYFVQGLKGLKEVVDDKVNRKSESQSEPTPDDHHFTNEGFDTVRGLVRGVLFQMMKPYVLVNIARTSFGCFIFFVFRE